MKLGTTPRGLAIHRLRTLRDGTALFRVGKPGQAADRLRLTPGEAHALFGPQSPVWKISGSPAHP